MIPLFRAFVPDRALERIRAVLESGYLAEGDEVRSFEGLLGDYVGNERLVATGDASSALTMCLYMAGVRPGDEVISTPMACVATNQPVLNLFARVVWCDVHPRTGNLDPSMIASLITPRTRAILFTHWAGDVADLDGIQRVAEIHGIPLVEDAGEALGAEYRNCRIGSHGVDYTVFSFHAIRHVTTGEGAAIAFASEDLWERGRWLKRYAIYRPSFRDALGEIDPACDIVEAGYNSYMTNISAAIGVEQMRRLESLVTTHRENGEYFNEQLSSVPGIDLCERLPEARSAYWVYTLLADRRDDLLRALRDRGVQASKVHHRNDIYSCFGSAHGSLGGLEEFSKRYLCIPCGWWVSDADREQVKDAIVRGW